MAQQQFYQPQRRKRDDDAYSQDEGWTPGTRASSALNASSNAQDFLGNIDDVLGGQEEAATNFGYRGGISESEARAAKNSRTAARRRQTVRRTPSSSAGELADAEDAAADDLNYTGKERSQLADADKRLTEQNAPFLKRWITKKKAAVTGGVAGGIFTLGLFGMTYVSGPLEFIHIAEILHDAHFGIHEDAGDGRVGKIYRFLRKGGSPGSTRLSYLGDKYHDRILSKLADIGIEPQYGTLDTYDGFTIDTEHENSPYKGMTQEEAAAAFKEKVGITPDIVDGKLRVNANTFWTQRKSLKAALGLLGDGKVATAVRARIMGRFGFVTWHPLKILDKKVNNTLAKIAKAINEKWKNRITKGEEGIGVDGSTAKQGTEDPNGHPVVSKDQSGNPISASTEDQQIASTTTSNPDVSSKILSGLKSSKGLSIAGGVAAAAAVSCALKAVNDNVALIRYTQVIIPAMRVGMDAITIGYQIMSGQDVDPYELQELAKNFSRTDPKTGKTTTWYDDLQIRKDVGDNSGGINSLKDNGIRDLITQSSIPWLAWTGRLGPICSGAGQAITGVVSIGIGLLTGGVVSTVAGLLVGVALTGPIIDQLSHLLAGQAIDATLGGAMAGTPYGGIADEGATLAANAHAISMGGAAMTKQQTQALQIEVQDEQTQEFRSKGVFARMFDPYDYRSLTGRLADSIGTTGYLNVNNWLYGVAGTFSNVLSMPFNLVSSTVHASNTQSEYFDHGYPIYGFNQNDQDNPLLEDPFANAETVAKILDNNNSGDTANWIQKAQDCFGVNITKTDQGWDAIPDKDINVYDTNHYNPADCAGPQVDSTGKIITADASIDPALTDKPIMAQTASTPLTASQATDWLRIRFFILDTSVMEGYACANFNDDQSCVNDGMSTAAAGANSDTATSASLATQILSNSKITLSASARADLQATAANQQVTPGPVASGTQCTQSPVFLNAQLLQGILAIAVNYSFTIDNLVSGHACDTSRHPLGRAVDITQLNGQPIDWHVNLGADKQFASDVANTMYSIMPTGTIANGQPINMPGIGVCHQDDISPPPIGVNYFVSSCDRLLVDVGVSQ